MMNVFPHDRFTFKTKLPTFMHRITAAKHLIIYADDDTDDLQLVQEAFSGYGDTVEVCLFESGIEAYEYLLAMEKQHRKPCLIVLDMNMPGLAGRELLPILRSVPFFDDVPIILFTTSSMREDQQFALRYNADFITKPMTLEQTQQVATEFLSHCAEDVRIQSRR